MINVTNLKKEYHTACFRLFMDLFKDELRKNREKLDVAHGDEVLKLQGENRRLKLLLGISEAREAKFTDKDGGYGES